MKTTVDIADPVLQEARRIAARRGVTLREVVEEGLRRLIDAEPAQAPPFRLRKASFLGQGPAPDAEGRSWDQLRRLVYEGRGA